MRCKLRLWLLVLILAVAMAQALAQTCRDDIMASAPDSRFTDNSDGTVTDSATGLIWKQCSEGLSGVGCRSGMPTIFDWQRALDYASNARFLR
jgi:hypothetical protein